MMKKILIAVGLSLGLATMGFAAPAAAHVPNITADCNGVVLHAEKYDGAKANTWSVTIAGTTTNGTFGETFDQTFPLPQAGATTTVSAHISDEDNTPAYIFDLASTDIGPCGVPPVVPPVVVPPTTDVCTAFNPTVYTAVSAPDPSGASNLPASIDTSNTRAKGFNQIVGNTLHTWTTEATSLGKAAGYFATPGLTLGHVGTPTINYAASSGVAPGFQLVLSDGRILVGEPNYYGNRFWSKTAQAGVPANDGYPASADLNTWFQALGDVGIPYIGYSVGSGVVGDSTITSLSLGTGCDILFAPYVAPVVTPPVTTVDLPTPPALAATGVETDPVLWVAGAGLAVSGILMVLWRRFRHV